MSLMLLLLASGSIRLETLSWTINFIMPNTETIYSLQADFSYKVCGGWKWEMWMKYFFSAWLTRSIMNVKEIINEEWISFSAPGGKSMVLDGIQILLLRKEKKRARSCAMLWNVFVPLPLFLLVFQHWLCLSSVHLRENIVKNMFVSQRLVMPISYFSRKALIRFPTMRKTKNIIEFTIACEALHCDILRSFVDCLK